MHDFDLKDSIEVEGIAEDYVWYQAETLRHNMQMWTTHFERVVKTMESRHREHLRMLQDVMQENHSLKKKLKEQQ